MDVRKKTMILAAAMAASVVTGFAAEGSQATLYERLGGMPAIRAVLEDYTNRILADGRVNPWFVQAAADPQRAAAYISKLAEFVCQSTGGPCHYTGPDLLMVHQGRSITSEAFAALVEDLVAALDRFHVGEKEKADLLAILGPMKAVVVQR
jgi:hemoglobin